jgi:hypothetical protein
MTIDLHMHSTASDGTDEPAALAALAAARGLRAIALTDHDTTAGLLRCAAACEQIGIDFVPGIELSVDPGRPRGTMHILGYFVRHDAPTLTRLNAELLEARLRRAPMLVQRLNELGLAITMDDVRRHAGDAVIGRPHIAAAMLERGHVATMQEAFTKFIGYGGAAFLRRDHLPAERAIEAIHQAGGVAVLAHAVQLKYADEAELEPTVRRLVDAGLDGIEVYHPDHAENWREIARRLAQRFDLAISGGSDYHGSRKSIELGSQAVPVEVLDGLRETREMKRT